MCVCRHVRERKQKVEITTFETDLFISVLCLYFCSLTSTVKENKKVFRPYHQTERAVQNARF